MQSDYQSWEGYTDEEREAFSSLMTNAIRANNWTRQEAADMAGVTAHDLGLLCRTMTDRASFRTVMLSLLGVGLLPMDAAKALNLDATVRARIKDPRTRKYYTRAAKALGLSEEDKSPIDQLLKEVPPHNREVARRVIEGVIEQFK